MNRFKEGELVRVRDVIATKRAGQSGRVHAFKPHKRGITTLDKYTVGFSDGGQEEFWVIQLQTQTEKAS
jgi:hypothetical protein